MKVKYFSDTDTAHVEFTDKEIHETKEISENIYIDIDTKGNIASMTIEHAKDNAELGILIPRNVSHNRIEMPNISLEKDAHSAALHSSRFFGTM